MEIRKGYKQTEVGVIPDDWDIKSIREITSLMTNGFVGTVKSIYTNQNDGVLYIQGYNVYENSFNFNGIKKVTPQFHQEHSKSTLREGDLLTIQTGDIGVTTVVPKELEGSNCHALIISRFKKGLAAPKFYSYYFNFSTGRRRLKEIETGSTMKHINVGDMIKLLLPYPNPSEQTAIATALSDTDALITSLEKLIAKKRNIKQGAMQELLKPKKGWEVKKFKDVCWFQEGPGLRNWQFTSRGIKVINVTNLVNGFLDLDKTDRYISLEEFNRMYKHFEIDDKDIVVASSGNSYGKVAVVRRVDLPLLMNTSVIRFKPSNLIDYNFLLTFLKSNEFKNQIDLLITGGAQPNFGPAHLNKIVINMPDSKEEQVRISKILFDMDSEITGLQSKLEKYKEVKSGMMQNLLTGKIRLV